MSLSATNPFYDKKNWSTAIKEIKTFASYGLLKFSKHCVEQISKRNISEKEIYQVISQYNTQIVQCHQAGGYNGNQGESYVLLGKIKRKQDSCKKPLHIVIAKNIVEERKEFVVVTAYVPSKEYFHASGRVIR